MGDQLVDLHGRGAFILLDAAEIQGDQCDRSTCLKPVCSQVSDCHHLYKNCFGKLSASSVSTTPLYNQTKHTKAS